MIGIIDSGVGGLSVLQEIERTLPSVSYVYHADSLYAPYGDKTEDFLQSRVSAIIQFLLNTYHIELLVLACNTSSAVVLPRIKERGLFPSLPIVDVLSAAIEDVQRKVPAKSPVGVLATNATTKTGAYQQKLEKAEYEQIVVPCPAFVPAVEHGNMQTENTFATAQACLEQLFRQQPHTRHIVLGCTHYPFLQDVLDRAVKSVEPKTPVTFLNPAQACAEKVAALLKEKHIIMETPPKHHFLTSGDTTAFSKLASQLMGKRIHAEQSVIS